MSETKPDLIAEVRALDAEATPGPWYTGHNPDGADPIEYFSQAYSYGEPGRIHLVCVPFEDKPLNDEALFTAITGNGPTSEHNSALIARYRTLAPQLADECERLEAEVARLRDRAERAEAQLAGCGAAVLGYVDPPCAKGDYGWSPSYDDAVALRARLAAAERERDEARRANAEFAIEIGRLAARVRVLEDALRIAANRCEQTSVQTDHYIGTEVHSQDNRLELYELIKPLRAIARAARQALEGGK